LAECRRTKEYLTCSSILLGIAASSGDRHPDDVHVVLVVEMPLQSLTFWVLPMTRGSFIFASAIARAAALPIALSDRTGTKIEAFAEAYAPSWRNMTVTAAAICAGQVVILVALSLGLFR
jgi:hypothetical protein